MTIGGEKYRVYRYDGALNDIEHGVVLLCWSWEASMEPKNMRCFLSTDTDLTTEQILTYYSHRWSIELYFKQVKGRLGFNKTQVRSIQVIKRYWILVQFAYLFLGYLMTRLLPMPYRLLEQKNSKVLWSTSTQKRQTAHHLNKLKMSFKWHKAPLIDFIW